MFFKKDEVPSRCIFNIRLFKAVVILTDVVKLTIIAIGFSAFAFFDELKKYTLPEDSKKYLFCVPQARM